MKIVTAAEMREIDRATSERFGVPSLTLMENAGAAVAEFVLAHYADRRSGSSSSAARAIMAATDSSRRGICIRQGKAVQVILLADRVDLRGDAAAMFEKLPTAGDRSPLQRRF